MGLAQLGWSIVAKLSGQKLCSIRTERTNCRIDCPSSLLPFFAVWPLTASCCKAKLKSPTLSTTFLARSFKACCRGLARIGQTRKGTEPRGCLSLFGTPSTCGCCQLWEPILRPNSASCSRVRSDLLLEFHSTKTICAIVEGVCGSMYKRYIEQSSQ